MSNGHALYSPSSAHRWLECFGSVALTKDIPDVMSPYALEGSAAHTLAKICLEEKNDAVKHVGKMYAVDEVDAYLIEEDMATNVQPYLDYVRRQSHKKKLLIEQRLPLTPLTGEENAFGTADAVIIDGDTLWIIDLKFGMGVKVFAEENEQMMMYAAAAAFEYSIFGDFAKFKLVIVQPRLDHIDEWETDLVTLGAFVARVRETINGSGGFNPGEDQCRFCKGKAVCSALADQVAKLTECGFEDLDKKSEPNLSKAMLSVGMVEDWCLAIRAEVERRLVSGMKVAGFKLVGGRMGARQWADAKAAEQTMKADLKLSEDLIYKKSLLSPTQLEKALAKQPEKWNSLQALITQKEGAPSVAPSTDPRDEIGAVGDSFEDLGDAV